MGTSRKPILPGVLILEAMAQATGILAFKSVGKLEPASCTTSRVSMKHASNAR